MMNKSITNSKKSIPRSFARKGDGSNAPYSTVRNTFRAIDAYIKPLYFDTKDIEYKKQKTFFNFIDGTVIYCDKKMSLLGALFHFHI